MILHFLLWDGQGFCPYEQEEMWWLILWPLISHRSYLGSRHWQWVFVALQHCPIVTDATTHMFLESCSLYILTRKQNYSFCLYYSVSSVLVRVSSQDQPYCTISILAPAWPCGADLLWTKKFCQSLHCAEPRPCMDSMNVCSWYSRLADMWACSAQILFSL